MDRNKKHYQKWYKDEFRQAEEFFADKGGVVEWSTHDYQAFTYKQEDKISLVFYPHKTTAGNHHIRVRDQGSKDKSLAKTLMHDLSKTTGTCTFSRNGVSSHWTPEEIQRA
jgi:hypothetical protein